jgi:hypothetical protein
MGYFGGIAGKKLEGEGDRGRKRHCDDASLKERRSRRREGTARREKEGRDNREKRGTVEEGDERKEEGWVDGTYFPPHTLGEHGGRETTPSFREHPKMVSSAFFLFFPGSCLFGGIPL